MNLHNYINRLDSSGTINVYELTMPGSPSDLDIEDLLGEGIVTYTQDDTHDQEVVVTGET